MLCDFKSFLIQLDSCVPIQGLFVVVFDWSTIRNSPGSFCKRNGALNRPRTRFSELSFWQKFSSLVMEFLCSFLVRCIRSCLLVYVGMIRVRKLDPNLLHSWIWYLIFKHDFQIFFTCFLIQIMTNPIDSFHIWLGTKSWGYNMHKKIEKLRLIIFHVFNWFKWIIINKNSNK